MQFLEWTWFATLLIALLEKRHISVDQGLDLRVLLTDLPKAFDCLPHSLLLAKLSACGFDMKAPRFINNYLKDCKKRTKISDTYSSWKEVFYGVPQGLILGPLLFNIDLCDLFALMDQDDIGNYADDNKSYVSGKTIYEVLKSLKRSITFYF